MVARHTISAFFLVLAITLVIMGCRQIAPGTDPKPGLFAKKAQKSQDGPPPPAPALYIPGTKETLPASNTAPLPQVIQPVAAQVPSQPSTQPEILPLQAPALADPNPMAVPGGPPLLTAPPSADPTNPLVPIRELYQKAFQKHASMDSYTLRLRRREVVGNLNRPEEILLFKWRRDPWSVYFKWLGNEGKGREVVYVKGRYENALHTLTAAGDLPLLPAGKHIKVSPDGVLVRSKSRYPITDAGLGNLINRFGVVVSALEKGDAGEGTVKYLGQLKRPEFDNKVEGVLQTIPPRSDPNLPRGGQRLWFFDPALQLPMLLITQDETGREVEYYCHDRFMYPVNLTDDDFNPDVLWKVPPPN